MKIIKKEEFVKFDIMEDMIDDFNKLWKKNGEGIYCINFGSRWDVDIYFVENFSNELEDIFKYIKSNFEIFLDDKNNLRKYIEESLNDLGLFEFLYLCNEEENEEGRLYLDLGIGEEDIRNYYIIKE